MALSFIAGMVNAVGYLGFQQQAVTHLTGTTTLFGLAISQGRASDASHLLAILGSFLFGTVLSGFLIQNSTLKLGQRYGVALLIESGLLWLAIPLFHRQSPLAEYLASCACGLQNAMASTYSGAVIRTTHVTGLFTDIGISLGHLIRGLPIDFRYLALGLLLIFAFCAGGVGGGLAFKRMTYDALYIPVALTGGIGLAYTAYCQFRRQ